MMVYQLDKNNFYIGFVELTEENKDTLKYSMKQMTVGYVKPKFINDEWIEGATEEEIREWVKKEQIDICPVKTVEERLEEVEQENNLLKAQVEANASNQEFLEGCIMEMAGVVYA